MTTAINLEYIRQHLKKNPKQHVITVVDLNRLPSEVEEIAEELAQEFINETPIVPVLLSAVSASEIDSKTILGAEVIILVPSSFEDIDEFNPIENSHHLESGATANHMRRGIINMRAFNSVRDAGVHGTIVIALQTGSMRPGYQRQVKQVAFGEASLYSPGLIVLKDDSKNIHFEKHTDITIHKSNERRLRIIDKITQQ